MPSEFRHTFTDGQIHIIHSALLIVHAMEGQTIVQIRLFIWQSGLRGAGVMLLHNDRLVHSGKDLKSHPQSEKGKKVTFSSPKKWIFMWVTRSKQTLRCAKASILFFLSWDAREFARGTTNWSVLYSTIGNLIRFDEAESSKCKRMDFARRDALPRMYISAATDR